MATTTAPVLLQQPAFTWPGELEPVKEITTREQLVKHLYAAAQVELSTIPPYLFAAYSIKTKGYSQWAPGKGALRTLIGVAIEEMLHLCLVRNVMIGIGAGDRIRFCDQKFVPTYPSDLKHRKPDLKLELAPLSDALVRDVFLAIEKPSVPVPELLSAGQVLEDGIVYENEDAIQYASIGELYKRIIKGLEDLSKSGKISFGTGEELEKRKLVQYKRAYWNEYGGGRTIVVENLETAKKALNTVIDQGEGADPTKGTVPLDPANPRPGLEEYTHYVRFQRMLKHIEGIGIVDGTREGSVNIESDDAVRHYAVPNPHVADKNITDAAKKLMRLFNASFTYMLRLLDQLYATPMNDVDGDGHSNRYHMERVFIALMQGVLYPVAELMMRRATDDNGRAVGPSFEFHTFTLGHGEDLRKALEKLCADAMVDFPELGGDDGVARQIELLYPGITVS
ncbi:ferritin-like protein [Streptomyces sp. NPDC058000]|uniref:ferritin-like domain-containing protein n=1 Tax=Streptomyces sp. NPDC058000 TaxID=3346299 RepID=UPI0036EFB145